MICVVFDPDLLTAGLKDEWDKIQGRCSKATVDIVDNAKDSANVAIGFQNAIWSELKRWLLANVFNNKCAYCECRITDSDYGDMDHYRPKERVTVLKGGRVVIVHCQGHPHRGYYWLAYHWNSNSR